MKRLLVWVYLLAPVWIWAFLGLLFQLNMSDILLSGLILEACLIAVFLLLKMLPFEAVRKIAHIGGCMLIISALAVVGQILTLSVLGAVILLSIPVWLWPRYFPKLFREPIIKMGKGRGDGMRPIMHLLLAAFALIIFLPGMFVIYGLLASAVGDSAAYAIGSRFGKTKIAGKKTLEGFGAFWATTAIALYIVSGNALLGVGVGLAGAAAELFSIKYIDDNASVPIAVSLAGYGLSLI